MKLNSWGKARLAEARDSSRARWPRRPSTPLWFRPQVERLEERAAPGDSLRSILFNFTDLFPVDNVIDPPATAERQETLGIRLLPSALPAVSLPSGPVFPEPDKVELAPSEASPVVNAPLVAAAQGGKDPVLTTGLPPAFSDPLENPFGLQLSKHAPIIQAPAALEGIFGKGDGGGAASDPPSPATPPAAPGTPTEAAPLPAGVPSSGAPDQRARASFPTAQEPAAHGNAAQRAADAINRLAFDLYQRLVQENPGNLSFSPSSLSIALAMTFAGARGETAQQMAAVLHFLPEGERIHDDFAALIREINGDGTNRPYSLSTVDALWGQQGYPISPDFLQLTQNDYGAGMRQVDFIGATEQARQTINAWAAEQTHGKITDLLPRGALDSGTRLVLTNAAYFNGKWEHAFDPGDTRDGQFHLSAGKDALVPLMNQTNSFGYFDGGSFQALSMGYQGGDQSMVVLLPKDAGGLTALEQSLNADNLTKWVSQMQTQSVAVTLPRFKTEKSLSLKKDLAGLGMPLAFSDEADFSGINGRRDLSIDQVSQKVFVQVGENGTEAAAVTGIIAKVTGITIPLKSSVAFHADHPFIYMIRDNHSGSILFMGRVTDPSQ